MRRSPLLEFEAPAFRVIPGEDEETNPGIFGRALAEWLAGELRSAGVPAGDVIAEDFGWCIPVRSGSHALFVACASTAEKPGHWRVFAFAEGGLMDRFRGRNPGDESLAGLYTAIRRCLESAPGVHALREVA